MPRRYVQVSLKHLGFLERQVVKVEIVNKHHEDWLGWEPGEIGAGAGAQARALLANALDEIERLQVGRVRLRTTMAVGRPGLRSTQGQQAGTNLHESARADPAQPCRSARPLERTGDAR